MATIQIDGIGSVQVGAEFLSMSPEQQAAEVDAIAAHVRGGQSPPADDAPVTAATAAPGSEEADFLAQANAAAPVKGGEVVARGSILPIGRTADGNVVPALPEFIEGPRRTIMDLLEGKRTAKDISGKEAFEIGALFAGFGGGTPMAGSTGRAAVAAAEGSRAGIPVAAAADAALPKTSTAAAPKPSVPPVSPVRAATPEVEAAMANPTAASRAELKTASQAAYKVADEAEIVLNPESFTPVVRDATQTAIKAGLDKTLTPDASAALGRLAEAANKPITFQDLMTLREVANNAAGALKPKDRMIASGVVDKIDDYIAGLSSKDVLAGATDPQVAAKALTQARELWSKVAKLGTVERLMQRAADAVANRPSLGIENAIRTEFINLARNDRMMRTFTPEERAAIRQIPKGTAKATMRALGRLAPTGPVSGIAAGGLGVALGAKIGLDPISATVVIGAPGFVARKLAGVLTQRSVRDLEKLIKAGPGSEIAKRAALRGRTLEEQIRASIGTAGAAEGVTAPATK
jgi:hypothetical protein